MSPAEPTDEFLIAGIRGGDEAALRKLMARYDRLLRFTIYRASKPRCLADPQWLDSVASGAWAGAVRSIRSGDPPRSVKAFLVAIARNHAVSALRARPDPATRGDSDQAALDAVPAGLDDPESVATNLELLEALRDCSAGLDPEDRLLLSQAALLLDRRWTEAAAALQTSESTLRYRWTRVLGRLRDCVEGETGRDFAPEAPGGDS